MKFTDMHGKLISKPDDVGVQKRYASIAFCVNSGYILLSKDKDLDYWEMPGGGVEEGEDALDALVREVREETGLSVTVTDPKPIHESGDMFYANDRDIYYDSTRRAYSLELQNNPIVFSSIFNEEMSAFGFFSRQELEGLNIEPLHREIIEQYFSSD